MAVFGTEKTGDQAAAHSQWIDPATLMRMKTLQMRARVVVEGFFSGLHRSPYHGISVEFSEYRQYTPGDDPRYLDWKLYARTDRYYVKRFEDETNLRCHLLVDLSRSMGFGSLEYDKVEYARTLAATFAYYLSTQRDGVGLLTFHDEIVDFIPARFRPGHLHRLMICLERALAGSATDLGRPIEHVAELVKRRGVIVLISDLLAPIDQLGNNLAFLRARGHEVIVMRVLDPAEQQFSFTDASMFVDLESGRRLYVDPQEIREEYHRRFEAHSNEMNEICAGLGVDLYQFTTDRPLELALFDFMHARMRRGRTIARNQAAAPRPAAGGPSA